MSTNSIDILSRLLIFIASTRLTTNTHWLCNRAIRVFLLLLCVIQFCDTTWFHFSEKESMQICFYHLFICVLPLEIQLSRWDPIIKLIPSQAKTGISNVICRVSLYVQWLKSRGDCCFVDIVRFVDISRIVDKSLFNLYYNLVSFHPEAVNDVTVCSQIRKNTH